jgi:hypothetical protein
LAARCTNRLSYYKRFFVRSAQCVRAATLNSPPHAGRGKSTRYSDALPEEAQRRGPRQGLHAYPPQGPINARQRHPWSGGILAAVCRRVRLYRPLEKCENGSSRSIKRSERGLTGAGRPQGR